MKWNLLFLLIGLLLSGASKWLQFKAPQQALIGNLLVFPAATFLVLAILNSVPLLKLGWAGQQTAHLATLLAVFACISVALFQLTTMLVFGKKLIWGLWLLVPFLGVVVIAIKLWLDLRQLFK